MLFQCLQRLVENKRLTGFEKFFVNFGGTSTNGAVTVTKSIGCTFHPWVEHGWNTPDHGSAGFDPQTVACLKYFALWRALSNFRFEIDTVPIRVKMGDDRPPRFGFADDIHRFGHLEVVLAGFVFWERRFDDEQIDSAG